MMYRLNSLLKAVREKLEKKYPNTYFEFGIDPAGKFHIFSCNNKKHKKYKNKK